MDWSIRWPFHIVGFGLSLWALRNALMGNYCGRAGFLISYLGHQLIFYVTLLLRMLVCWCNPELSLPIVWWANVIDLHLALALVFTFRREHG